MSKELKINIFDQASIQSAIAELDVYKAEIENNTQRFLRQASETVRQEMDSNYGASAKDGVEDDNYSTYVAESGKDAKTVIIQGKGVLFVEFGTGITKADSSEARSDLTSGNVVGHGEYGHKRGANPNGWYYNGKLTYGIDAQTPVYTAKKHLKENMEDIAKEAFKND